MDNQALRTKLNELAAADANVATMVAAGNCSGLANAVNALGLKRLRLVMGNSMGGMQTWMWGVTYPDFMDALVPMASQPTDMSSRNWMMRRMIIDAVRNDPEWKGGDYTVQPPALRIANVFFGIATSGGTLAFQQMAPTREAAPFGPRNTIDDLIWPPDM